MTQEEFTELLDRYIKGECSVKEQRSFDAFFDAFQRDEHHWSAWDLTEKDRIKIEIYRSLNRIIDDEEQEHQSSRRNFFSIPLLVKIAASVSLLLSVGWLTYAVFVNRSARYITETTVRGERITITLTDGSVVKLNAGSSLSFPDKFASDKREVLLTGEAFFDVTRDPSKPFIVRTGDLRTAVLGTSFNIRAYQQEGKIDVTVRTGTVRVENTTAGIQEDVILKPDQQAHYDVHGATLEKRAVSSDRFFAWTSDIIYLDNTKMTEVVGILENWYDIKITLENESLGNCLLSGKYKGDRLQNILEGLKFMQGIEYRLVSDREVLITGKPCN